MIALTTGEILVLEVFRRQHTVDQIVARIQEAKAAAASGADADAALLHCSGTPAARIRALRALGRAEGDYRSTPVSTEQLWQTFESSAADPEARASAAIALRARLDASCAPRLRVVAAATAAPKLRVAIERAAGDDDAALEEALAALEADGSWRRTRRAERRRRSARRRLMPEPTSPFEGVSLLRLRPRFFALAALILAVPAYLFGRFPAWWGWQDPKYLTLCLGLCSIALVGVVGLFCARWVTHAVARPRRGARGPPARRRSLGPRAPRHLFGIRRPRRWLGPDPASRAPSSPCDRAACSGRWPRRCSDACARARPAQWAACYRLPPQGAGWLRGVVAILLAYTVVLVCFEFTWHLGFVIGRWPLVFSPLFSLLAARAFGPRLMVGADGISLVRMRRARFIPYDEIADVKACKPVAGRCSSLS